MVGGEVLSDITTVGMCREACINATDCLAVDWIDEFSLLHSPGRERI